MRAVGIEDLHFRVIFENSLNVCEILREFQISLVV